MRFSDIFGHTREITVLKRSVAGGCVAHAYLFAGPEGVGKRLAAMAVASALNCSARGGEDNDPCGGCADCRTIAVGTHPNVMCVEPSDGVIKIERVRELQEMLRLRVERGMKVVVVDGADRLHPAAANAFLKTLEEPPPGSVIILLSSRPSELLPTILSRCQRLNFRPLPEEAVRDFLVSEGGVDEEVAVVAARLSGGSVSRAERYIDAEWYERRKEVLDLVAALDPGDSYSILAAAEELSKRDDIEEVLEFLKTWLRDRAVSLAGESRLVVNADMASRLDPGVDFRSLWDSFVSVERARREVTPPRYGNKLLVMETLLMRLALNGGLAL